MANKYLPLRKALVDARAKGAREVTLTFAELDRLIPEGLPASARKYRAWWSNSGQPHSEVWHRAGWLVDGVDQLGHGWVRFRIDGREVPAGAEGRAGALSTRGALLAAMGDLKEGAAALPSAAKAGEDWEASEADVARMTTDLSVHFHWVEAGPITLDPAGRLKLPPTPSRPGVYRISRRGGPSQARTRLYIGEAEHLPRRMVGYRAPGPTQTTNIRMNGELVAHLKAGGTAALEVAVSACVTVGSGEAPLAPLDFAAKSARLLAEAAAVVEARWSGEVDIDNRCEAGSSPFTA